MRAVASAQASSGDLEQSASAGQKPPKPWRRPQLFLILVALSLVWLGSLVWLMHDLHPSRHSDGQMEGADFLGGDIDSLFDISSPSECRAACEQHPRCMAFTYVKAEHACWLKGAGFKSHENPNTVSGVINSTLADERKDAYKGKRTAGLPTGEEEGESYGDMHAREARGFTETDDEEGETDGGGARGAEFTYDGGRATRGGGSEYVEPYVATDEEVQRHDDSTSWFGDVSLNRGVASPGECESLCVDTASCVAWTMDKHAHECMLRLVNVSSVRYSGRFIGGRLSNAVIVARAARRIAQHLGANRSGDGATAGAAATTASSPYASRAWPMPPELVEIGTEDNTDLRGGDIVEVAQVDTFAACRDLCVAHTGPPRCTAFTLSKGLNVCYLKTANYTHHRVNKSAGLISGLVELEDDHDAGV